MTRSGLASAELRGHPALQYSAHSLIVRDLTLARQAVATENINETSLLS